MQPPTARMIPAAIALLLALGLSSSLLAEDKVDLQLTFPNGRSPKVFTEGWTFGAKATLNPGTAGAKDISPQVKWSGTGSFSPDSGSVSHPTFAREGINTIELKVIVGRQTYAAKFTVEAVKPQHATVGDQAHCPADAHACPACPHPVVGPIMTGNPKVKINGRPVACVGDTGSHRACCATNTFTIVSGDDKVLVDGKPVARLGSKTKHCGGIGTIISVDAVGAAASATLAPSGGTKTATAGAAGASTFTQGNFSFSGGPCVVKVKTKSGKERTEEANSNLLIGDSRIPISWSGSTFSGRKKETQYAITTETSVSGTLSEDGKTLISLNVAQTMDKPITGGSEKTDCKFTLAKIPISRTAKSIFANISSGSLKANVQSYQWTLVNSSGNGTSGYTQTFTSFKDSATFKFDLSLK